jgi:hypothetical protein
MPRGPAPGWRKRKDPVTDDYILASVNQAGGPGKHDPATGHYGELLIEDLASKEEAIEYRNSLFRCALWLHRNGVAEISMSAKIERAGKQYRIRFAAVDKTWARQHVLSKYGPDRSKWPYDPRRRGGVLCPTAQGAEPKLTRPSCCRRSPPTL